MHIHPLLFMTTFTLLLPGSWPTLSSDPTLALALTFTLWDSIFTSPPPERDQSSFTWLFITCTHNEIAFTVIGNIKIDPSHTWLVLHVVLGSTFCGHFAQVNLFI